MDRIISVLTQTIDHKKQIAKPFSLVHFTLKRFINVFTSLTNGIIRFFSKKLN